VNAEKIRILNEGGIPIHEPGLDLLVQRNVAAGRLQFTTDMDQAMHHGTILFIAVGTPPGEDGSADMQYVKAVAKAIGERMTDYKVIVDKSTVPVGTADTVRATVAAELARRGVSVDYAVVSNPEFLKEGAAIEDFMKPDRIVVGSDDEQATLLMRALYAPFLRNRDRMLLMDVRSAELTKYVANAMLATRISFMNEIASLAERVGADIDQVRLGIGSDARIGTHFLYAGCGWGGSCLPKDVRALARLGEDEGVELPLLQAAARINERQRKLLARHVVTRFGEDLRGHRIAVWGLAFKPETDDMREASSLVLAARLLAEGAEVRAFDPVVGTAADRLKGVEMCPSAEDAVKDADAAVLVTEWASIVAMDWEGVMGTMRTPVVIDGRNALDPLAMEGMGYAFEGIGRIPAHVGVT